MKSVLYASALFLAATLGVSAQSRVAVGTAVSPRVLANPALRVAPVQSEALPLEADNTVPSFMAAEEGDRFAFSTLAENSDSSFILTNDAQQNFIPIFADFPTGQTALREKGAVQMVMPQTVSITIDTIVMFPFQIPSQAEANGFLQGNLKVQLFHTPASVLRTISGSTRPNDRMYNFPFSQATVVYETEIDGQSISDALSESTIAPTIIELETPAVIPANRAFGVLMTLTNLADTIRILSGYEWSTDVTPLAGGFHDNVSRDTAFSFSAFNWNTSITDLFPSLAKYEGQIRQNFDIRFFGSEGGTAGVDPVAGNATAFGIENSFPNPVNNEANVRFSVPAAGHVTLRVVNSLGQTVATLVDEQMQAGVFNASFSAASLPAGAYFTILSNGTEQSMRPLQIVR